MSLLATLRAKKQNREIATLTVATDATHAGAQIATVAGAATVTVASPKNTLSVENDPAPHARATDPDLWCWPHSPAINTREIETFKVRLTRFTDKGVSYDEAERLADALVIRDREGDDRRLCLDCTHMQGFGCWRCSNWLVANVAREGLGPDLVRMLQRCAGFKAAWISDANFQMISENHF